MRIISSTSYEVVIVGAGAAGFFAAITCAEANPQRRVLILEKGTAPLAKVKVSGGGRCNVTHACFVPKELVKNYPRGARELLGPFHTFQPRDTVAWFESRGVPLKVEADGRMFPTTDSSQTIIDCLMNSAKQAGVEVRLGVGVAKCGEQPAPLPEPEGRLQSPSPGRLKPPFLSTDPTREFMAVGSLPEGARPTNGGFKLTLTDGTSLTCSRLLLAAGGLKPGPIVDAIQGFGHTITPLAPSLFTFHIKDPRLEGLPGVAVPSAEASIPGTEFTNRGPVLITHWGLSGPAILKLSAWAARWAQEQNYQFTVRINWLGISTDAARAQLDEARRTNTSRLIRNIPLGDLSGRFWERLVAAAGISDRTQWSHLRNEHALALANQLTACDLPVTGKSMFKEEFVTCGGVALKEINFKTMESRIVPGLHFAGEVLDIDGLTGGFNFQAAWTGGRLAGLAMAS